MRKLCYEPVIKRGNRILKILRMPFLSNWTIYTIEHSQIRMNSKN